MPMEAMTIVPVYAGVLALGFMALAVFDVTHSGWWQGLDDRQLGVLRTRLEGQDIATADDRQVVSAFVETELAHRGTAIETPR